MWIILWCTDPRTLSLPGLIFKNWFRWWYITPFCPARRHTKSLTDSFPAIGTGCSKVKITWHYRSVCLLAASQQPAAAGICASHVSVVIFRAYKNLCPPERQAVTTYDPSSTHFVMKHVTSQTCDITSQVSYNLYFFLVQQPPSGPGPPHSRDF